MSATTNCPACSSANPSDAHLVGEYFDLMRHTTGVHGTNATRALLCVGDALVARGIREIPSEFFSPLKVHTTAAPGPYRGQ